MKTYRERTNYRSTITQKLVSKAYAEANPETTESFVVRIKTKGGEHPLKAILAIARDK